MSQLRRRCHTANSQWIERKMRKKWPCVVTHLHISEVEGILIRHCHGDKAITGVISLKEYLWLCAGDGVVDGGPTEFLCREFEVT